MVENSSQLPVQRKIPDLPKGCVLVALSSLGRGLLRSLLTEVLLLPCRQHVRRVFLLKPKTALITLLATTQVALVRFINLATGAKVET
jgi:hypothetical protein